MGANLTEEELRQIFLQFGDIVYVKIPASKGCGFVQFAVRTYAEESIQKMQGAVIGQQAVRLSWGRSPTAKQTVESFLEDLVLLIANHEFHNLDRTIVIQPIIRMFKVCRSWRKISNSNLLWQNHTRLVWNIDVLVHDTWQDEYMYQHLSAVNFRVGRIAANFYAGRGIQTT